MATITREQLLDYLDDALSDAHAALAQVKFLGDWDWAGAEKSFRRALDLNPDSLASC